MLSINCDGLYSNPFFISTSSNVIGGSAGDLRMYTYTSDSLKVLHEVVVEKLELDDELLCDELSCSGESWWRVLRSWRDTVAVTDTCSMLCFVGDASYVISLSLPDILAGD
tara:strand:- start:368 stop:700 length:333 start_codon:yes stop_codon:yes gene_type:complete